MTQKAMKVVVELNLRAVSCPGVHLQAKDDIYLSVCLMNQYRQSECLPAVFPLLFREKIRFEKVFWHATDPGALAEILECEIAKVELIQLTPPVGESLASFVEDVRSFLFPEPKLVPPVGGVDRAVLMSRGPTFMGICPRLEFNTRTVISECSPSPEAAYDAIPLRVLTQKRRRKPEHRGSSSPDRLSSSVPWRRGRERASAGSTRARSLSPYNSALLDGHSSSSTHRLAELPLGTRSPASSLTESVPESWCQHGSESWRGSGQSSASLFSSRTSRARSPSPSLRSPQKPGRQTSVIRRSRSSGWALDEDSCSSDMEDLLDYGADEDLSQSGTGRGGSPSPAAERPHVNGSLLCSQNVWEDVQTRLRSLLTSPKAMDRLANGATDSEVDEVLARRSISPHSGPA
ncbi:spermatogenesis associated 6-like protein [Clupea harengus]|uniref:Spermatogenesis associated 6-like protein n=1 Tax=Clupea harengus TaxID=7950 RepID=A0A6P8GZF5_CLUHA|nr:spermatogenesis associated 6-like protein [Clupea harengus]XP_031440848.1 spermatogenesis associated 6-like protein [Clupea harengus]